MRERAFCGISLRAIQVAAHQLRYRPSQWIESDNGAGAKDLGEGMGTGAIGRGESPASF